MTTPGPSHRCGAATPRRSRELAIQAAAAQGAWNERQRIIALAEQLQFRLYRPSRDGPGGGQQALDVVPLAELLKALTEEGRHDHE